ncbi:Mitotic-spindle organizing protein 1 [Frankliniella fusca]|uniref:Mitotic-spindle organizing protein 1 n=1 Tax=Frankliniella fusca TaxID=407009 RepID=A0AAE1GS53_9NEOP|nr:Mitotic-spindle organizing protein 1 [Frankliniella fusca]
MADASDSLRAREALALLSRISKLLNTGLDTESLAICIRLCEAGVHPEALAKAIQEVRREVNAIRDSASVNEDPASSQPL